MTVRMRTVKATTRHNSWLGVTLPSCSTLVKCLSFCYLVWKAKTNYYKRYFETNIGNIKKSWKRVNSILCRTLPTTEINRIDIGDNSSTTPSEISNVLNYHLTNIGPRLAGNIPGNSVSFEDYTTPSVSSFTLNETSCDVHRLVCSLRIHKATDLDGISARLLKKACPKIVPSLP